MIYQGTVEDLRFSYDRILLVIRDKNIEDLRNKLSVLLPEHKLSVRDNALLISSGGENSRKAGDIFRIIAGAGFVPESIEVNPKTVNNAYEEIVLQHDLQKQLL